MTMIAQAQWNAMGQAYFADRLRAAWQRHHPELLARERVDRLDPWIFRQVARAADYGMVDERSAGFFVYAAWLLGADFDRRIPVLVQILNEATLAAEAKQRALADFLVVAFGILEGRRSRHE